MRKFKTVGHHRSLWCIKRDEENEERFIEPNEINQVQIMTATHGELDENLEVIVSRLGRAPIIYAPLDP
jgi:hypothetical protein